MRHLNPIINLLLFSLGGRGENGGGGQLTGSSSTSTLTKIALENLVDRELNIGPIMRHGPHQVAVKSITNCVEIAKNKGNHVRCTDTYLSIPN